MGQHSWNIQRRLGVPSGSSKAAKSRCLHLIIFGHLLVKHFAYQLKWKMLYKYIRTVVPVASFSNSGCVSQIVRIYYLVVRPIPLALQDFTVLVRYWCIRLLLDKIFFRWSILCFSDFVMLFVFKLIDHLTVYSVVVYSVCSSVHLSQAGIVSKQLDECSWFLHGGFLPHISRSFIWKFGISKN